MNVNELKMIGSWVFVKPDVEEKETGGIIIPETAKEVVRAGTVVNVKEGGLQTGSRIMFKRRAAFSHIEIEGEKLLVMRSMEVLASLKGDVIMPLRDLVVLEWEQAEAKHHGTDFIRPDSYREAYFTGIVIACGPEVDEAATGDRVFWDQFSNPEKFMMNGKRHAFVQERNIYCSGLPERVEA